MSVRASGQAKQASTLLSGQTTKAIGRVLCYCKTLTIRQSRWRDVARDDIRDADELLNGERREQEQAERQRNIEAAKQERARRAGKK